MGEARVIYKLVYEIISFPKQHVIANARKHDAKKKHQEESMGERE